MSCRYRTEAERWPDAGPALRLAHDNVPRRRHQGSDGQGYDPAGGPDIPLPSGRVWYPRLPGHLSRLASVSADPRQTERTFPGPVPPRWRTAVAYHVLPDPH